MFDNQMKMQNLLPLALAVLVTGCAATPPYVGKSDDAAQMLVVRMPAFEIRDQELATCLIDIVNLVNGRSKPRIVLSVIIERDEEATQRRVAELRERYSRLYELCSGRRIALELRHCRLADILDLATSCAELGWEYRDETIRIVDLNGEVLVE